MDAWHIYGINGIMYKWKKVYCVYGVAPLSHHTAHIILHTRKPSPKTEKKQQQQKKPTMDKCFKLDRKRNHPHIYYKYTMFNTQHITYICNNMK